MNGITIWVVLGISLWTLAIGLTLWGNWLSRVLFLSSPPHLDAPFNLYPVSIIKPLKGSDAELESNLESFFRLDYPDFELLLSVAHASDPAAARAKSLIARYPAVRARLFVGEVVVGSNPKINNMMRAYEAAANDWVLISDSNVRVSPSYLKRMVAHLEPGVGMVTSVVAGYRARGFGGALEATYLNSFYARGMNLAARLGRTCVVGKSMLFQRSTASHFGGLRGLGRYLAEDFMAGEAIKRLGLRVVIASDPVPQIIGDYSVGAFWKRHIRWGRLRKHHGFGAFVLEPWLGCLVSGVIGAYAMHEALGVNRGDFFGIHLTVWFVSDLCMMVWMRAPIDWATPWVWLCREALALPLWIQVASGNTVNWRGHRLAMQSGGVLENSTSL